MGCCGASRNDVARCFVASHEDVMGWFGASRDNVVTYRKVSNDASLMIQKMGKNHEEGVFQLINPQRMLGGILLDNRCPLKCEVRGYV